MLELERVLVLELAMVLVRSTLDLLVLVDLVLGVDLVERGCLPFVYRWHSSFVDVDSLEAIFDSSESSGAGYQSYLT